MGNWPLPPFFKDARTAKELTPVEAVIFAPEGKITGGRLTTFLPDSMTASFAAHGDSTVRPLKLSSINSIQLIYPIPLVADTELIDLYREAVGPITAPTARVFHVRFVDGENLRGKTKGFIRTRQGLFIFLSTEAERVVRIFIPENALESYQVGGLVGQPLVETGTLKSVHVVPTLGEQTRRSQSQVDAHLGDGGISDSKSLTEKIGQLHSFAPVRLGDILMNQGLVSRDQLLEALRRMKLGKHQVLGTVLVLSLIHI